MESKAIVYRRPMQLITRYLQELEAHIGKYQILIPDIYLKHVYVYKNIKKQLSLLKKSIF